MGEITEGHVSDESFSHSEVPQIGVGAGQGGSRGRRRWGYLGRGWQAGHLKDP